MNFPGVVRDARNLGKRSVSVQAVSLWKIPRPPQRNRHFNDGDNVDCKRKKNAKSAKDKPARTTTSKKRVTASDVASCAGVSPATVSIVLSERRDISIPESTRDRVKQCAAKLGYLPSRLGEGFLHGHSKLVGLLLLSSSYLPLLDCAAGIQDALAQADYMPLILSSYWLQGNLQRTSESGGCGGPELPDLDRLLGYQVEGVLYFSTDTAHTAACIKELGKRKIPLVALGDTGISSSETDVVGSDNTATGRIAAEHLMEAGCTSFVCGRAPIMLPHDSIVCASFTERLKAAGHTCRELVVDGKNPDALKKQLLQIAKPPAGLLASNDEIAPSVLRAALSLGWVLPHDFAVVAVGQTELSQNNILPISTVNRNSYTTGLKAAELLLRRMEGFSGPFQKVFITPSLEVRASSMSNYPWFLCSKRLVCRQEEQDRLTANGVPAEDGPEERQAAGSTRPNPKQRAPRLRGKASVARRKKSQG